jgi:large subunit ribosomal protein L29
MTMAMTKIADVRGKSPDELQEMLVGLRKEQFNLRFQRATGQLEAVGRIKEVRRTIARVKTIMAERSRASASDNKRASGATN